MPGQLRHGVAAAAACAIACAGDTGAGGTGLAPELGGAIADAGASELGGIEGPPADEASDTIDLRDQDAAGTDDTPPEVAPTAPITAPAPSPPRDLDAPAGQLAEIAPAVAEPAATQRPAPNVVRLTGVSIGDTADHDPGPRPGDQIRYGWGAALVDFDDDGDVDVLLGGRPETSAGCVYRNDSLPGTRRLTRVPGWCLETLGAVTAGAGIRTAEGSALVVSNTQRLFLVRAVGAEVVTTPLDGRSEQECAGASVLQADVDLDGDGDLIVGCQPVTPRDERRGSPLSVFLADGSDWIASAVDGAPFNQPRYTLALAGVDVDDDGLGDVVHVVDTFSRPGMRNTTLAPGGWLRRCTAEMRCLYEELAFSESADAWGSFMGAGVVRGADGGAMIYLADWGLNRMFDLGTWTDRAEELGVALDAEEPLFSWGVVVDDWDRNGLDDLLVTRGTIPGVSDERAHALVVLLQDTSGVFARFDAAPSEAALIEHPRGGYWRGAAKVDLDHDGRLEVLVTSLSGAVAWLEEAEGGALHDPPATAPSHRDRARILAAVHPGRAVALTRRTRSDRARHLALPDCLRVVGLGSVSVGGGRPLPVRRECRRRRRGARLGPGALERRCGRRHGACAVERRARHRRVDRGAGGRQMGRGARVAGPGGHGGAGPRRRALGAADRAAPAWR